MLFDQGSLFVLFSNISLLFLLSMCIHYEIAPYSVFLAGLTSSTPQRLLLATVRHTLVNIVQKRIVQVKLQGSE